MSSDQVIDQSSSQRWLTSGDVVIDRVRIKKNNYDNRNQNIYQ